MSTAVFLPTKLKHIVYSETFNAIYEKNQYVLYVWFIQIASFTCIFSCIYL